MEADNLKKLIDKIEDSIYNGGGSMLNYFQAGIALKFLDDRLWGIDDTQAQRCNDLCHYILEHK